MSPELDENLCKKYPKIFVNRYGDMRTTAMCWGFDCGDGWYNIIDALCANIQHRIDWSEKTYQMDTKYNAMLEQVLSGRREAYDEYFQTSVKDESKREEYFQTWLKVAKHRQVKDPIPQAIAVQVKEKFGTLRFYIDGGNEVIHALIGMAESMSARTCEKCGSPGRLRGKTWLYTACDAHTDEVDLYEET